MTLRLTFHSLRIVFVPFLFVCRVKVCHFGMLSIDPIRGISRIDEETICGSPVKNTEKGLSNISLAKTVKNAKHPRNRNYCFASLLFPHWIFLFLLSFCSASFWIGCSAVGVAVAICSWGPTQPTIEKEMCCFDTIQRVFNRDYGKRRKKERYLSIVSKSMCITSFACL